MRRPPLRPLPWLAAALLPLALGAQEPAAAVAAPDAAAALQQRIDDAIAAYEEVRGDDDKDAQRRRMLGWLGELDHPRVTAYLKKELGELAGKPAGAWVVEALGKVPRPDLEDELVRVVRRRDAHYSVRTAATKVVLGFGDAATERLLGLAARERDAAARRNVVLALSVSGSARAEQGLAELLRDADNDGRLFLLQHTQRIRGEPEFDAARVRCVREGNLLVSATAWRTLAEQRHPDARRLTIDVLERVFETPDAPTAAELVRGLVLVRDPDFYPAILRFGAVGGPQVRRALEASAKAAADDPALVAWLIDNGLDAEPPAARTAAKLLLTEASAEALQPLVERVRAQLRRNRKRVLETAAGLHELLAKDPTWAHDLAELAGSADFESRMLGLSLLLESGSPAAVPVAQRYLRNRAWELRSLAIRYLTRCRDVTSIPELIERYGKEEGRLAHELDRALFVHTGTRCWTRKDWDRWWREHKDGFTLPHPDSVSVGGTSTGGQTISYYGIPLVSDRIAFLVDHSGSMRARVGTDKKRTRLDAAKEQLRSVVEALGRTHRCNLIPFETGVGSLWDELRRLDNDAKKDFLDYAQKIPFAGGTNTYGALMRAFEDPDVDTVYLLTDGQPTAGELTDPDDILDAVARINRTRQVVIHCISIGLDSYLLKELAALTGGEYKYVR